MSVSKELLQRIATAGKDARKYVCGQSFAVFFMYYFSSFFSYAVPGFHFDMFKDLEGLTRGEKTYLLWVMFRESAKTTIVKVFVVWCICYRKKRYINWTAYDKDNAEAALFDIATWLQENPRILADFGQLFYEERGKGKAAKMKRISEFITANKVKVEAFSTQESARGRVYDKFRPDLFVFDDFETVNTKDSAARTQKIIAHIDEVKTGMSVDGQAIFLCNFITEGGSVAGLIQETKENPESWGFRQVDVEMDGEIAWPDKYVRTEEEARRLNEGIADKKARKVSLEKKKKDLNSGGRKVYETEMLNDPGKAGDLVFNRQKIDRMIEEAKKREVVKEVAGFRMWANYKAGHRYAIGGDSSGGVGRDSCASAAIDFSAKPCVVMGTFESNIVAPDVFGFELANQGRLLGECYVAPEINNQGYATLTQLKAIYPNGMIYRRVDKERLDSPKGMDLGWETNGSNKADIIYQLASAIEDGELEVWCVDTLKELRAYTKRDMQERRSQSTVGITKHFDRVMALAIAWEMRHHAPVPRAQRKPFRQGRFQAVSEYQGGDE